MKFADKTVIEPIYLLAANREVPLLCGKPEIQMERKLNHQFMFLETWHLSLDQAAKSRVFRV